MQTDRFVTPAARDTVLVKVRFFATHRETVGADRVSFELPGGASVADLIETLVARFPDIQPVVGAARFAVNREYAAPTTILHDGDEVALIPPVAGGRS
ncbi:MAG TPA: molybdopterin converting factor subunit 1 [Chloroflexota bacterium]|nr:molybdopterin converting factor subunit 1 [Chloroflexota bacterium]